MVTYTDGSKIGYRSGFRVLGQPIEYSIDQHVLNTELGSIALYFT